MRKLILLAALLALVAVPVCAQGTVVVGNIASAMNPSAADPYTCDASTRGHFYWNTTSTVARSCDGSSWADWAGSGVSSFVDLLDVTEGKAHDYTGAVQWDALCFEDQSGTLVIVPCTGSVQSGYQMHSADGGVLEDTDDINDIFINTLGVSITITKVTCKPDTGTPTIMLQKDDGTAANMFSAAMTCTTTLSGTDGTNGILTSFVAGENVLAAGDSIKLLTATAGGAASYYTVFITYKRTP